MKNKSIKLYWWNKLEHGKKNFGDWLSPVLVAAVAGKPVTYSALDKCDLVGIGSILHRLKNHFWTHRVHVWGSGLIEQRPPFRSPHIFHAVRGKSTAAAIKNQNIKAMGDPGLLSDMLLPERRRDKRFRIGIVPHYVDQRNPAIVEFTKQAGVTFIDIFCETLDFIEQVDRCEFILSSSLHGLIIADALGIPNGWIKLSDNVRGNDFKFSDYYSVFGLEKIVPLPFTAKSTPIEVEGWCSAYKRPGLEKIKTDLYACFPFR